MHHLLGDQENRLLPKLMDSTHSTVHLQEKAFARVVETIIKHGSNLLFSGVGVLYFIGLARHSAEHYQAGRNGRGRLFSISTGITGNITAALIMKTAHDIVGTSEPEASFKINSKDATILAAALLALTAYSDSAAAHAYRNGNWVKGAVCSVSMTVCTIAALVGILSAINPSS